jgi:hypothetical protein
MAEQVRLGRAERGWAFLGSLLRRGELDRGGFALTSGREFLAALRRDLRRYGYRPIPS